jgi:hypothetical protein
MIEESGLADSKNRQMETTDDTELLAVAVPNQRRTVVADDGCLSVMRER